uniref:Protein SSUH2 homolog n=1 Tax=Clastoptera arizonana TaxID=38151 RepID=A0A1B6D3I1_9HEMI
MPAPRRPSMVSYSASRRNSSVKEFAIGYNGSDGIHTTPALELMDVIPGYENLSFEPESVPPPMESIKKEGKETSRKAVCTPCPEITEQQLRAALVLHVGKHCCYSQDAAKTLKMTSIQPSSAFHYQLETYTEQRENSWAFIPFSGNTDIDTSDKGPAPLPWDIPVKSSGMFENEMKTIWVPHTSSVKYCFRCNSAGSSQCLECYGKGWVRCLYCNGDGFSSEYDFKDRCFHCRSSTHGFGRLDCLQCKATGKLECPACDGAGFLLYYIRLIITWKTNKSEFIKKSVTLPEELVKSVSGEEVFSEVGIEVLPIVEFPDATIITASTQLLQEHCAKYSNQKILMQRQHVRIVPITSIKYEWRRKTGQFFVCGKENKVYAPDYPQTCCWGCHIL